VPALLVVLALFVYPFIYGLQLSVSPIGALAKGGALANYAAFFGDPRERLSILNTLRLAVPVTLLDLCVALPLAYMFRASVFVNVILGVFNLFPLLPLDGGRVLTGMLPLSAARAYSRLEPYGFLILLVLLYTDSVERVINPIINSIVRVLI